MIRSRTSRSLPGFARHLSTEPIVSTPPPSGPPPNAPRSTRARLSPGPRPTPQPSNAYPSLRLPPTFGRNQMLEVPSSTRALLEEIVGTFRAPIRYAFAYGSGVFEQGGSLDKEGKPMLDFMFAVTHPSHWHSINLNQNPHHYAMHARLFGSDFISWMQKGGPGVWFNAYVPMSGVTIKYGVTTVDNLCEDLLNWKTLYLAGRMHKPLRIIKDDPRVRLTQQVNLVSAVRAALLTLPEKFDETELFERIAGISYAGDPRMSLPFENRSKVSNIVSKQGPQFKELYRRLVIGLPGVEWGSNSSSLSQDLAPHARSWHLRKLPSTLIDRLVKHYSSPNHPSREADENAFWIRVASDPALPAVLQQEMRAIVRSPATIQTLKGVVSAGFGKSIRYGGQKALKWWKGGSGTPGSR